MGSSRPIDIREVVTLLGLKVSPKDSINSDTFNVQCPFCGDKKYHMNINRTKNAYACVLCSKEKGQGYLDLYSRVVHGVRCIPGPNGNGKEIYKELCDRLHYDMQPVRLNPSSKPFSEPTQTRVVRATDEVVGKTYGKLLEFPPFQLSERHRQNLISRGLSDSTIQRNQYRTIPQDYQWLDKYQSAKQICADLGSIIQKNKLLKKRSSNELAAGFALCAYLQGAGCTLEGVPGFFKVGDFWCFNIIPGMLVPTRSMDGNVVALQVRRDKPKNWKDGKDEFLRYLTVSSKGYPRGVTEGISRAHFPLGNPKLTPGIQVCVTEGPLKSDAAVELINATEQNGSTFFIALHGTMNTKELPGFFKYCKKQGIQRIWNAFDMDKTTNVHVANAGKGVWKKAKAAGLGVVNKCWDEDYAKVKRLELSLLCAEHDIFIPTSLNVFVDIANMARALETAGVRHSHKLLPDGTEVKDYWAPDTKGIDDFLLKEFKRKGKGLDAS
jgi:DNA primase